MKIIKCQECGIGTPRRSPVQKYCEPCSEQRDLERKRNWARKNPPKKSTRRKAQAKRKTSRVETGKAISAEVADSIGWTTPSIDLSWQARIAVDFSYGVSKNAIYTSRGGGHVALRRKSRAIKDEITLRMRNATAGRKIAHNKLWLDILVQKPNHRGDAINVIDLVCDGVKEAVPVDDRWFSIRSLDWEVAKNSPKIFIAIGQDTDEDAQVCSYCGRILSLEKFGKRKDGPLGHGRECKECCRVRRRTN